MVSIYLEDVPGYSFDLNHLMSLKEGMEEMHALAYDIVLLDLSLPDSMGLDTLQKFLSAFPKAAVIVLTGLDDAKKGLDAVRAGAYDYLIKGDINSSLLSKSLLYAAVKRSNADLSREKEIAQEAAELKQRFLAHMSHELRTPLNVVIGMSQLIDGEESPDKRKEYLDSLSKSARDLLQLINNVLDFSKLESGKVEPEVRDFDLEQLLSDLITIFKYKAEEKGLRLILDSKLDSKKIVVGDSHRLKQVLTNLLQNAIKYTKDGEVKLSTREDGDLVHFDVSDTGIGITEDQLSRIFQSFTQASESITRRFGGTGLGLTIAKEIVHVMGGELSAESTPGQGSIFKFYLPLQKGDVSKTNADLAQASAKQKQQLQTSARLLVADDHELNRIVVREMLSKRYQGISIDFAENGLEAIEQVQKNNYELILMDISMPKMDGHEAIAKIRSEWNKEVPIIVMTAHFQEREREKSEEVGANGFLNKPVDQTLLYQEIEKHLTTKVLPKGEASPDIPTESLGEFAIDLSYMDHLSNGDLALKKEIIESILDDFPKELVHLSSHYQNSDFSGFYEVAHKMKTSLAYFGVKERPELKLVMERNDEQTGFPFSKTDFDLFLERSATAIEQLKNELG